MNKRQAPLDRPAGGQAETPARRLLRLSDATEGLAPMTSSERVGSTGIAAEIYRTACELEIGPISLEDTAVLIVHKGTVAVRLLFAETERTLIMGGVAILPAATVFSLQLSGADITICYLRADSQRGLPADLAASREIVPALDPRDEQVGFLMNCIRIELQRANPAGTAYLEALGLALMTRLYACFARRVAVAGAFRGGLTPRQLREATSTILSALDQEVPLAALAQAARLSKSHFSRAFKTSTGASPRQWRLNQRIELARGLIGEDKTITSIAVALGFASLSHFSAAFKRATGLSPSDYRRKCLP